MGGGANWKRNETHAHTRTHAHRDKTKGGSRVGREGRGNGKQSHTEDRWQECWEQAQAALPGITEIVFKALKTLNVRRAETLPRFTNSVIYLQDQMHSYYTAQAQTHTRAERRCLSSKHSQFSIKSSKSQRTVSVVTFPACPNSVGFYSRHGGKVIEAWNKYGPRHAMH